MIFWKLERVFENFGGFFEAQKPKKTCMNDPVCRQRDVSKNKVADGVLTSWKYIFVNLDQQWNNMKNDIALRAKKKNNYKEILKIQTRIRYKNTNDIQYQARSTIRLKQSYHTRHRLLSAKTRAFHYSSHKSFSTNHPFHRVVNRQERLKREREGRKEEETAS